MKRRVTHLAVPAMVAACCLILAVGVAFACTGITVKAKDGAVVHARTMEFADNLESRILIIPRGQKIVGTGPGNKPGLSWKTKYGAVGLDCYDVVAFADGMNEKGLAAGVFYLPGFTQYQKVSPAEQGKSLAPWEIPLWILTNFATVEEVKTAISKIKVWPGVIPSLSKNPLPLHFITTDKSGQSLVIEYVKGKLHLYDNPLGVITNSPPFDWHLNNLRNYVNLSANNVPQLKLSGITLYPTGQGSGMLGLPGDVTPPARLVRAVAFTQAALPVKGGNEAARQAFRLLNSFYITKGMSRGMENGKPVYDFTQWMDACDLKNLKFYVATYYNLVPKMVDLKRLDLSGGKILRIPIETGPFFMDVTAQAK